MSNVQKISIALPKTMTKLLKRAVSGGQYASTSEVVREALRDWQEKQEAPSLSLEDLRRLWQDGVDSGPGKLGSFDAVLSEAKRRVASRKAGAP
jgi:antitoxin ParD1/3/4